MKKLEKSAQPRKHQRTVLATYAPKNSGTSWGNVAGWYDRHLSSPDTYHEKVLLPNILRLVDPKPGEQILDLASGQGYFTEALAKRGATMTGIDAGAPLIALATKRAPHLSFREGNAEDLTGIPDASFHKTVIVLAIQNIENAGACFREVARVLRSGGELHLVMNHPAFRIPKLSSWGYDDRKRVQYRRLDAYLSESRVNIEMHPGEKDSPTTPSFHRPLQHYFKALAKAGFAVDRLEEWTSQKESDSGPRRIAENNARKEFPLFLYIGATKQ